MVTIFFTFPGVGGGWEHFEQLKGVVFWTIIFFIYLTEMFFETSFSFTEAPYVKKKKAPYAEKIFGQKLIKKKRFYI